VASSVPGYTGENWEKINGYQKNINKITLARKLFLWNCATVFMPSEFQSPTWHNLVRKPCKLV